MLAKLSQIQFLAFEEKKRDQLRPGWFFDHDPDQRPLIKEHYVRSLSLPTRLLNIYPTDLDRSCWRSRNIRPRGGEGHGPKLFSPSVRHLAALDLNCVTLELPGFQHAKTKGKRPLSAHENTERTCKPEAFVLPTDPLCRLKGKLYCPYWAMFIPDPRWVDTYLSQWYFASIITVIQHTL